MKTQIKVLTGKNAEDLAKKINEDKIEFFATQIYPRDTCWVAFCYHRESPSIKIKK